MELYLKTWPEVEEYLKTKKTVIVPIGSTEQHGPNGIIGIDYLSAWAIAKEAGKRTNTLVSSPLPIGMALHHMNFAGSLAFKPSTYMLVIQEIIEGFVHHGFNRIVFVNGHGGNIPTVTAAFSEHLQKDQKTRLELINWWHQKEVTDYEKEHFQDQNGFHATIGEVSVTMFTHPEGYEQPRPYKQFDTPKEYPWPLSPAEFRRVFPDGRMGSNPALATAEHGKVIFENAVRGVCLKLEKSP